MFKFIGLEMPDEVPASVRRHGLDLLEQFLNTAFAEDALTGIVGFAESLDGMKLGYSNKFDARGERRLNA